MGRSSVKPWTAPSTNACQFVSAPARSPTPRMQSRTATPRATPAATMMPTRFMRGESYAAAGEDRSGVVMAALIR